MMRTLLSIRFRALISGLMAQSRRRKKGGAGMTVLFTLLYLYVIIVVCGMTAMTFLNLAGPYHALGLDWLYFAMAGMMGLGLAVIGSVFTTQSQLYDAKDNDLLLSMPVPPRTILLSRMVPLLALNLLFASIVMLPAMVVYAVVVAPSPLGLIFQLFCLLAVTVLAQAIACLLGWLLHLLLSKMNKSFASMLYMVLFLGVYFYVYSQASQILSAMAANGQSIAQTLHSWVWPMYAMGRGCLGSVPELLAFLAIAAVVFGIIYLVLTLTFLRTATMRRGSKKRRKLDWNLATASSPSEALIKKEFRKFLGCPVYLTNMGMGIILTVALAILGILFKGQITEVIALLQLSQPIIPLIICALLSFTVSTICISTPSVSLEGKSIWILKSMPLTGKQILSGKLRFHCRMVAPVSAAAALVLSVTYGCSLVETLLTVLFIGLLALLCGLLGLITGLKWVRLDYLSEAYPCKQSISIPITMFVIMGVPIALGLIYGFGLADILSPVFFLAACVVILLGLCLGLYRAMITWGVRKWDSL